MTTRDDEFDGRPELVKKKARSDFFSNLTKLLVYTIAFLMLAAVAVNAYVGSQSRKVLVDCTTPEGKCFKSSQERSAALISKLIQQEVVTRTIVVTAVACAKVPENNTLEKVQTCVDKSIKEKEK